EEAVAQQAGNLSREVQDVVAEARESGMGELGPQLETLAQHARLAENKAVANATRQASAALSTRDAGAAAAALGNLAAAARPAVAAVAPAPAGDDAFEEEDLRDIFLEEAREVVANGLAALQALAAEPGNLADMTTLRRAFHTLK